MSSNLKYEKLFKIPMIASRLNRTHPSVTCNSIGRLQFYVLGIVPLTCCVLLINSIFSLDLREGRLDDATKNGAMVIVTITCSLKCFLLLRNRESIRELIATIDKDYVSAQDYSEEEKDIVKRYAKMGVKVTKLCLAGTSGTCVMFPMQAIVLMTYYYLQGRIQLVQCYEMAYPKIIEDHKFDPWLYCMLFVLYLLYDTYAGSATIGFDPLIPIFMTHTCRQLELLNLKISKLFTETDNPKDIEEKLKIIIRKQQLLYRSMDAINDKFSLYYDFNMKATTPVLPLSTYRIVEDLRNKYINMEFILLIIPCALQFFMPCYYSDLLMESSENFRYAIYSCGWEKCPKTSIRKTIHFMLTRARSPMAIKSVFYTINLDTFAEMCRQSYAKFNLMRAVFF